MERRKGLSSSTAPLPFLLGIPPRLNSKSVAVKDDGRYVTSSKIKNLSTWDLITLAPICLVVHLARVS